MEFKLTSGELAFIWNVTQRYPAQNGDEIDLIAGLRNKLRPAVEDLKQAEPAPDEE